MATFLLNNPIIIIACVFGNQIGLQRIVKVQTMEIFALTQNTTQVSENSFLQSETRHICSSANIIPCGLIH